MKKRISNHLLLAAVLVTATAVSFAVDEAAAQTGQAISQELLPPNAKAGECYTRVWVPATYKTDRVEVLVQDASSRIEIVPAKFEWTEERVLVKEASEKLEIVPAVFEWVEEKILVKPASSKLVEVSAKYEWTTEQVLDREAHTIWKKGRNPVQPVEGGTGEIMCLVEVPATYKTVKKKVLREKAHTEEVAIPAEHSIVRSQVVKTPATVRKVEIPAQYKTVKVRKMVSHPTEKAIVIPERHETVTQRTLVKDGRMEWRAILCETNIHANLIRDIQVALRKADHDPGSIDGVMGSDTLRAMESFQRAKGLAEGGITVETLKALEVNPGE